MSARPLLAWWRGFHAVTRTSAGATWLFAASFALWFVTVARADYSAMGQLGLVTVLGWTYYVGLILLCVGFANELLRTHLRNWWLIAFICLLVVYLFATGSAIEPIAALADSYRHAGLLQYVYEHGQGLSHYVADFSWPGAFSLGSIFVSFSGLHNALAFTRWFPPFIELLFLPPLIAITRAVGVSPRARWLGIALFYAADWIDQDYFSPQALGYTYMIVILALVLVVWVPRPFPSPPKAPFLQMLRFRWVRTRQSIRRARILGRDAESAYSPRQELAFYLLMVAAIFSLSMSHELSPYALVTLIGACLLTRHLGRPEILVASILFSVGWLSLGASDYWIGHLSYIFSGVGQFGSTISSNVSGRVSGNLVHRLAAETRIMVVLAIYLLAGVGALRRSLETRVIEALAVAPFVLLAISSYVGEGLMRVVLYALPFTALLAANAILPTRSATLPSVVPFTPARWLRRWLRPATWLVVLVALLSFSLATTVARGGNDDYESFTVADLQASNYVYDHATLDASIALVSPYFPFNQRDIARVYWNAVFTSGTHSLSQIYRGLLKLKPEYIVLNPAQLHWGEIVAGLPSTWEATLTERLLDHGFHVAARFSTTTVIASNALVKTGS